MASDVLSPAIPPAPGPMPLPVVGIPAAAPLGLVPGDVVSSTSFGLAPPALAGSRVYYDGWRGGRRSLLPAAGDPELRGPWAAARRPVPLKSPPLALPNVLVLDGNGIADSACAPAAAPGLGLLEPSPDNVFAVEMCPASFVFSGGALAPAPVYFTLASALADTRADGRRCHGYPGCRTTGFPSPQPLRIRVPPSPWFPCPARRRRACV